MNNKLITLVLTLVIGIIVTGSVLMPVLDNAKEINNPHQDYSNVNANTVSYGAIDNGTDFVYDGSSFTINDVESSKTSSVAFASDTCFMYFDSGSVPKLFYVDDSTYSRIQDITAFDIVVNNGSFSGTVTTSDGNTPIDYTYSTYALCPNSNGNYVLCDANFSHDYTVKSIDQIWTLKYSGANYYFSTIGDAIKVNGVDAGTCTVDATAVEGMVTGYTVTVNKTSDSDVSYSYNDTTYYPHYVIVPKSVSLELSGYENNATWLNLMSVIPVVVIVAIFMTAVGAIALRRAD